MQNQLDDNNVHVQLETALKTAFQESLRCILILHEYSIGIIAKDHFFYVFDAHSRDSDGMVDPLGNAVLVTLLNMKHLCNFLRQSATSINANYPLVSCMS